MARTFIPSVYLITVAVFNLSTVSRIFEPEQIFNTLMSGVARGEGSTHNGRRGNHGTLRPRRATA